MKTIIVPEHEAGERLDAWLVQRIPERSRSAWQKAIKGGAVAVNGRPAKAHAFLKAGDAVSFPEKTDPLLALRMTKKYKAPDSVKIVDETSDFLVIEKPSGLLVHPAPSQKTGTLIDFLLTHDPKIASVGDSDLRPGIVHRLDREASGLMVVARTLAAFEHLKKQFQTHAVKKEYLALVQGKVSKDTDVIETPIGRKKGLARMSARTQPMEGDKEAKSVYDVVERFPHATLVKIRTETGRMHQVRVHMKSIGHPLVGDSLYAAGRSSPSLGKAPRLFLHAAALGFKDAAGEWREYHSELAPDLKDFLDELKKRHGR